jgi:mannose-1-phosphate guanylyltransferase
MKIILFAGGSGKRFWPRSRKNAPKQFLNVNGDKPLVREAFERVLKGFPAKDIFLSTGKKFEGEIKQIIPELPAENLILEPDMRDTGPAVTLGVSFVHAKFPDEVIAALWSDHIVKDVDTFVDSLKEAEKLVKETGKIVFLTVPARFASVHRGYIQFNGEFKKLDHPNIQCLKFKQFEEKPSQEVAEHYVRTKRYGWNPGYWVFDGDSFLKKISQTANECFSVCQEVVKSNFSAGSTAKFSKLEKISADYTFAEKVYPDEALVLLTEMGWSDVGEWIALKEALSEHPEDNVIKGNVMDMDSKDSIIHNYEDGKLLATIGLDGFVVVNTKDVVAIFKKEDNAKLKEYLKKFEGTKLEQYL